MAEGLSIELEIDGLEKISKYLNSAVDRVKDWQDAAEDIVTIIQDDARLRFQSAPLTPIGGMVYGDIYWRPLSEGYLASRPDRQSGQILIDSGDLKRSVTENTIGSYVEITDTGISVGTSLEYGKRLQQQFPFLFWHPILLDRVSEYLTSWYLTGKRIADEK